MSDCHLNPSAESISRRQKMKAKPPFASIFLGVSTPFFSPPPAFAHPANPSQDQGTAQTQSGPQDKTQQDKTQQDKQKAGPGKEVGNGGEDVGKGTAKGAGSLGKDRKSVV